MPLLVRSLLARAPACLHCNGTRVRRSTQVYGTFVGVLFVAVRCQECGRRFPLPRRVAATQVTVYNRMPASATNKNAVEGALRRALASVPGEWTVEVRAAHDNDRWLVQMRRGGGQVRVLTLPRDASAEIVYDQAREALRCEGLIG
jgi:transcription elongation factor Elf1